jgi:EH domain-containing protein 1
MVKGGVTVHIEASQCPGLSLQGIRSLPGGGQVLYDAQVQPIGEGEYSGFQLGMLPKNVDGGAVVSEMPCDETLRTAWLARAVMQGRILLKEKEGRYPGRFLLGDRTVSHNSSFITYLLEGEYPGCHIGPEPTTDRFVAVMGSKEPMVIPGNALVVQADMPFRALSKFGNDFLNKFQASMMHSPILDDLVVIDTPGVLSGEKQRIGRSYDFTQVVEWFAQRADMIILVFDAHKLDISDEFKRTIEALKGQDDKIRVVLNKADGVTGQQLLRVYGALMWSLGKVLKTPEVMRVYVGSFWGQPYQNPEYTKLFDAEREDLLRDLHMLPRQSTIRKVNELVKRARLAKVHAYIISHLKSEMPVFGKKSKMEELIRGLNSVFNQVMQKYNLPLGDFPDIIRFRDRLQHYDFSNFPKLSQKMLDVADEALANEIPKLVKMFPLEQQLAAPSETNPFEFASNFERSVAALQITEEDRRTYSDIFRSLKLVNGKAPGGEVKQQMLQYGLPKEVLSKIWNLCDRGKHGALSEEEFIIAMALIKHASQGNPLPEDMPAI